MTNKLKNMTLEEKKNKLIEMIREIPDESPIHKELYEIFKEATHTGKLGEEKTKQMIFKAVNAGMGADK